MTAERDARGNPRTGPARRGKPQEGREIPPLRGPTRQNSARREKSGRSGPFDSAQGRRDDRERRRDDGGEARQEGTGCGNRAIPSFQAESAEREIPLILGFPQREIPLPPLRDRNDGAGKGKRQAGTMSSKERRTQTARIVPLRVGRRTSLKAGHYKGEGASARDGKTPFR
jgi:hypothetical protein